MKRNFVTLAVGTLLLLIFLLLLFVFQVRQTEVAVVTTFGKPTRDAAPGAHLKWPWPFEKVFKFDQRVHNLESKFDQVYTADGFTLLVQVYTGWSITEPKQFFPAFGDSVRRAEESLEGTVRNAYSGVVGQHPLAHFISTDPQQLRFTQIEQEILQRIGSDLKDHQFGIQVKYLGIKKLGLPESVTKLVFERMQSERQVLVSEIESEGKRQAEDIRSAANLESANLLADAQAEATQIEGQGAKQALKSFEVFEQNPSLATFLLKLKALESFLKENSTLIFDQNTSPFELLTPGQQPNKR